jgi:heterodisulfide reductase subunit A-like polyferredoxin
MEKIKKQRENIMNHRSDIANQKKVGAAMVVGGGIGGMQAALDLAESGIKVYLVETKPCIGGVMSQLDKTFPTNDCAMCTMAPRLVEIGRHKDIEIITLADVEGIRGQPGNFNVTLKKRPRYIDEEKCTGCGECAEKCPIEVPSEHNMGLDNQKAIYRLYPQAIPPAYFINKKGKAPCRSNCPADVAVQGYVALIREGKYFEALKVHREDNPFPSICGRVCTHPCEENCTRNLVDNPVSVRSLKRFIADYELKLGEIPLPEIDEEKPGKIAVIGSGPAGLTASYYLAKKGYKVTIFEALPVVGGMLKVGIPEYRLPSKILDLEIDVIKRMGVEIKTNHKINSCEDIWKLKYNENFDAIFLATGAHKNVSIKCEGECLKGVISGVDFLKDVALSKIKNIKGRIAVIGGGNVAVDSARTALRLGTDEVSIFYRRSKKEMPAIEEEVEDALQEGIKINYLTSPVKIEGEDNKVKKIILIKNKLGEPDSSGRRRPVKIEGSEFSYKVDHVILAVGQEPDVDYLVSGKGKFELTPRKTIKLENKDLLLVNKEGIFAGGDLLLGPSTVAEAIGHGKSAADIIARFLEGEKIEDINEKIMKEKAVETSLKPEEVFTKKQLGSFEKVERVKLNKLDVEQRVTNFKEVVSAISEEEAIKEASRCLTCGICSECHECITACEADAIDYNQKEEKLDLKVGSIIFSPGYDLFDAGSKLEYGYSNYSNVITALEFERILSASGPYEGKVLRPSDKLVPKKIAFIQCVGSRDTERDYCSSICCMYATKEAIIAKEHAGEELECHVFFMDMRAFGKGFDAYYERAKELGVKYIRCRPSSVEEIAETKNLKINYVTDEGKRLTDQYDLVVLSVGMQPPELARKLNSNFGIKLNEHGFCWTDSFKPVESNKEGIFVCGPFTEPKDIPETVMQAGGAASKVLSLLSEVRGTLIKAKEYPPEKDVTGQAPRIGIFICHCGTNIAGVVDVPGVVEYAKTLPDVVYVENNLYTCSNDTQEKIKKLVEEHNLNRVVVASCTPRTHEPLFRNTIREARLNPYLFEIANIRDQCSWVHMHEPEKATRKAKDLVRMAVAKVRLLEPLQRRKVGINHSALVIGGGLSGMSAALEIAEQGYDVYLIEKEKKLGGNLQRIYFLFNGEKPQEQLDSLIERIKGNKRIHLYTDTKISNIEGSFGNFKTTINKGSGKPSEIEHGVIIVATGAQEYKPTEYLYGKNEKVITQLQLEEWLSVNSKQTVNQSPIQQLTDCNTVVMIQCVGSRDDERPYCSRVCCSEAVKNALKIKEVNPKANVFILYRDIRTYGFKESYYSKARQMGVIFIRYEEDKKPEVVEQNGVLKVSLVDPILNRLVIINTDLLVLSAGTIPHPENKDLAQMLKVPLDQDKFFLEAHMKLRPVDFATDGIFLCGLAHSAKSIEESITQACAAAARASTILSKDTVELEANISFVVDENCDGCAYCIDPCPYKALTLIEYMKDGAIKKTVEVNESICKGCGTCMATCPKMGIYVKGFKLEQISAQVGAALQSIET